MRDMLARMRVLAREWRSTEVLVLERDADGLRTWIRVPDLAALLVPSELTAVGFFGVARAGVDHAPIHDLEARIVDTLEWIRGLLSYFNLELPDGRYGNLILCADPQVPDRWHAHELHRRAVELAPRHYRAARLHRAVIRSGLLGDADLEPLASRELDFETGYTTEPLPT
jgi:hypothetical protein